MFYNLTPSFLPSSRCESHLFKCWWCVERTWCRPQPAEGLQHLKHDHLEEGTLQLRVVIPRGKSCVWGTGKSQRRNSVWAPQHLKETGYSDMPLPKRSTSKMDKITILCRNVAFYKTIFILWKIIKCWGLAWFSLHMLPAFSRHPSRYFFLLFHTFLTSPVIYTTPFSYKSINVLQLLICTSKISHNYIILKSVKFLNIFSPFYNTLVCSSSNATFSHHS